MMRRGFLMLSSDFVDVYVAVGDGIDGEGRDALHAQLLHDVLAVGDDGGEANVQTVGNLFVDVALHDEGHHLGLAAGEHRALKDLGHRGEVLALGMGVLLKGEEGAHQLVLGNVDADRVELAELRFGIERQGEYDGLAAVLGKELAMLEHDAHCHEVVEIMLGMIGLKLSHASIGVNGHDGHDVL